MAYEEFEDISQQAILMLCKDRKSAVDEFARKALSERNLLVELGEIVFAYQYQPLEEALLRIIGPEWTQLFKEASEEVYRIRRIAEMERSQE